MRTFRLVVLIAAVAGLAALTLPSLAADPVGPDTKEMQPVLDKAIAFLKTKQNADGSFAPKLGGPGVSAMVAAGLVRNGVKPDDPLVSKAMGFLEKSVQKDGGIYDKQLANYSTCVALLAFHEANTKGKYDAVIKDAAKFLKGLQTDESKVEDTDIQFGGVGYNGKERADLSNTQYFMDALLASGMSKDDPAIKRALKFVTRCQNLAGEEANDQPWAKKASEDDKGGLTYNPVAGEKNPNRTADGGLRSAGVMTYAGLKSFLTAGVSKEDARVKAATDWIRRHYTLDSNPGQGKAGLFYYYHTFGKAMNALGDDEFTDKDGKKHDWRRELFETLKKRQAADGSWANEDRAFFENNQELATAYALLALSYCKPATK
jgi:hypothetical protein